MPKIRAGKISARHTVIAGVRKLFSLAKFAPVLIFLVLVFSISLTGRQLGQLHEQLIHLHQHAKALERLLAQPAEAPPAKTTTPSTEGAMRTASEPARSGHWPVLRAAWLKEHPACAACGASEHLTVHHVVPFQVDPRKELDATNLITLCERCHLVFGHLGDWQSRNPDVRIDAAAYQAKRQARPRPHKATGDKKRSQPCYGNSG
jgi:5-methylcytosine-specific restriction endonuclease McrA